MPMTDIQHHTKDDGLDQFVPVRKSDIIDALLKSKSLSITVAFFF